MTKTQIQAYMNRTMGKCNKVPEQSLKTVTITLQEYLELKRDADMLEALNKAGVDNWEGFDDALDMVEKVYD